MAVALGRDVYVAEGKRIEQIRPQDDLKRKGFYVRINDEIVCLALRGPDNSFPRIAAPGTQGNALTDQWYFKVNINASAEFVNNNDTFNILVRFI